MTVTLTGEAETKMHVLLGEQDSRAGLAQLPQQPADVLHDDWRPSLGSSGVTAHGSMPHLVSMRSIRWPSSYGVGKISVQRRATPLLGLPTLNVGAVNSGLNVNSVPDRAEIGIDIRSVPGLTHDRIREHLRAELGDEFF